MVAQQCWVIVTYSEPTIKQHWAEISRLTSFLNLRVYRKQQSQCTSRNSSIVHMSRRVRARWLETQRYWVRIPVGVDVCRRGCAHTVLQTVQRPAVCCAGYGSVHDKEPFKSLDNSRA